ncbi:MAG: efflux RND transporter permease subunit, partial [Chlorobiales bacterium]|nr:efflux RND transporter permease subunit [Chlorobiales bacterium]
IMTLGGLALAVGILVDDATVEIENVHRNLGLNKPLLQAILDGAQQIALPAFVGTLSICIVFIPIFFLSGVAAALFSPLAMAVIFAMLASYFLSRTLVPTMMKYLLGSELALYKLEFSEGASHEALPNADIFWRIHRKFHVVFERLRERYLAALRVTLEHKRLSFAGFTLFLLLSLLLVPFIGRDFFPRVDAGQFRLHVNAPPGTRIEETERIFGEVESLIREIIPPEELGLVLDNIGLPYGGPNLIFSNSATIGISDGEILVSLKENHGPTEVYMRKVRTAIKERFPDLKTFYQPGDIVTQILNFGAPAPIDVQIVGKNQDENYKLAKELEQKVTQVIGAKDVHVLQVRNVPQFRVNVDRIRAEELCLTQRDVATNMLISLSGTGQTSPSYWINPQNGVSYSVVVQTPPHKISSLQELQNTPISDNSGSSWQLLSNLATIGRGTLPGVVTHYNVQPTINIFAVAEQRDLGSVASDIQNIIDEYKPKLPPGTTIVMRGQVESMDTSFIGLGFGLFFAIMLVYFLMVINFQSWLDPLIIITALPGAICGIIWMLYASQTTFNVPSLTGTIMCIGVATANSILLITFANEQRREGMNAHEAALSAGFTRLRPVIMTALAMILGMLPMSLGFGEGGEQNAPLGRAVIGGLLVATVTTLFFVPVAYSVLRKKQPEPPEEIPG